LLFDKDFVFDTWIILKNLDFSKILLLGLGGIESGILEISAYLLLDNFLNKELLKRILLNYVEMYCLKDLLLFLVVSLSQPASWIIDRNSHAAEPNSVIYRISFYHKMNYSLICDI